MFCGLQYRMLRRLGGARLHALVTSKKPQPHQRRNEAQLNCVALRSQLDYEVAWRAVKGQDERQKTAPLTTLHATPEITAMSEKKNKEGRHVGLDFYDLLIEARSGVPVEKGTSAVISASLHKFVERRFNEIETAF